MVGIYKIVSPSNKVYIGQSINIEKRFEIYYKLKCKNQPRLYYSLKKYSVEKHKFEILEKCSLEELNSKERYWQEYYNVLSENGLNCKLTKTKDKSGYLSQELKDKISNSSLGISRNKGRVQSLTEKQYRSKIKKGIKHTPEHIENYKKSMIGKNLIPIICINTGEIFESIKYASLKLNLKSSSIDNILQGRAKSTRKDKLQFKYYKS
jgi:group I intron endonuclease